MARWIDLDSVDPNTALWLMPDEFIRFDQREPPWPNRLWHYGYWFSTAHADFNRDQMIAMRRWFEQTCRGDVVVRLASRQHYNDHVVFYVDNAADAGQVWDRWSNWIVEAEGPL